MEALEFWRIRTRIAAISICGFTARQVGLKTLGEADANETEPYSETPQFYAVVILDNAASAASLVAVSVADFRLGLTESSAIIADKIGESSVTE